VGEAKRRSEYLKRLELESINRGNAAMSLTKAEKESLCLLLREDMKLAMQEEVRNAMRADAEAGQFNSSGSAGKPGDPGEKYDPSALKEEPFDGIMKRLDALAKRFDA